MEKLIPLLNDFYTDYHEPIWIVILFGGIVIISLILAYLFEERPEPEKEGSLPEEMPRHDVSPFTSAVEPLKDIPHEERAEVKYTETDRILDKSVRQEILEQTLPDESTRVAQELDVEEELRLKPEVVSHEDRYAFEKTMVDTEESYEIAEKRIEEVSETKESLFSRLRSGLSKTQVGLVGKLDEILSSGEINEDLWDEFEEALITADLGVGTTLKLRQRIEEKLSKKSLRDPKAIMNTLKQECLEMLKKAEGKPIKIESKPFVIIIAGVNGVGKTTTIGKIAYKFSNEGKSVMVAAADTFRAAAVEQLEIWAKRVGADFLRGQSGSDPSAVAFDALKASQARETDILIVDTAGRLHTRTNLMEELKKLRRVISRELDGAPNETLLVLDATTGQNAIQQAKMFNEAIDITGIILTKLDGTAKGGVILAIADELNVPVKFIGIGESLRDLREFNAEEFVEALFVTGEETIH
ncbi:MAG: signal recognition particle-docking protein FtsY [Thermodesulfobacteriota bacterium]